MKSACWWALVLTFAPADASIGPLVNESGNSTDVLYAWNEIDYDWSALGFSREDAIANGSFVPEKNALAGVKVHNGSVFATIPRWKAGVPSTLNKVVDSGNDGTHHVMQPFPSAWFNSLNNSEGLKYVQSMEVDSKGRMWIIDVGRSFEGPPSSGAAKVVIWDIAANAEVDRFVLPSKIADPTSNFMNDIVVDEGRMIAYISDAGRGAIIVVDMANKRAAVFDDATTKNEPGVPFVIQGEPYTFDTPTDGIALTPDREWVYYCALQGLTLYRVSANRLRAWPFDAAAASASVQVVGTKTAPADGMVFSDAGTLYSGGITDPLNNVWFAGGLSSEGLTETALTPVGADAWADTFSFDGLGSLVYTCNHLNLFLSGTMNFSAPIEPNFSIKSVFVGENSYVGGLSTKAPPEDAKPVMENGGNATEVVFFGVYSDPECTIPLNAHGGVANMTVGPGCLCSSYTDPTGLVETNCNTHFNCTAAEVSWKQYVQVTDVDDGCDPEMYMEIDASLTTTCEAVETHMGTTYQVLVDYTTPCTSTTSFGNSNEWQ